MIHQKQVVEIFDDRDFPRRQFDFREPHECVDVRPFDRHRAEAIRTFATSQPLENIPEIIERWRRGRTLKGRLVLRNLCRIPRPINQPLQRGAIGDAVFNDIQLKRLLCVCPQFVSEGGIKARSAFRYSVT